MSSRDSQGPSGVLVVDKPAGPTSFDVVARVKRLVRASKAGHTGTLDPAATGVLAVCLGEAVKLQQFLVEGDKAYEATVAFGAATDTEDAEGRVVETADASGLDEARLRAALPRFVGEIEQVPPMYSAIRVAGRRLHEAARAGEAVERAPRRVRVDAIELLGFARCEGGTALARLHVRCGKGTYIRTLAADLGRAVGVPAHLAALRRTAAGPFTLAEALPLAELERLAAPAGAPLPDGKPVATPVPPALLARVLPPEEALRALPAVRLSPGEARDLGNGRVLALGTPAPAGLCRALDAAGALLAVCESAAGRLRPVRVLRPAH